MSIKGTVISIVALVVLLILFLSLYTVTEGQRALILRLGKIESNAKTGQALVVAPGLHAKAPFVTSVRDFDVRLQTLNVDSSRILTAEQKYVVVSYYAKWRIADLPLYYRRTNGIAIKARNLLTQQINGALRAAFGSRTIKEVIAGDRQNIMALLQKKANQTAKEYGIKVDDVRIVQIDLPQSVRESVYQRMSTKREQVATEFRAQGKAQAEAIKATADAKAEVTIATAKAEAQQTRADGDALAAKIYTTAYSKDPQFYALYRSLEAYKQVFTQNKDTVMVLKPQGEFFRYFMNQKNGSRSSAHHAQ